MNYLGKSTVFALTIGALASVSSPSYACPSYPMIAQMCIAGFNYAPRGWLFADGSQLSIANHTALFSLLGTTYGGDGRVTFNIPDTRGRVLIGAGRGAGLTDYRLGQRGGVESMTLTVQQLASHTHSVSHNTSATVTIDIAAQVKGVSASANQAAITGNRLAQASGTSQLYTPFSGATPLVDMAAGSLQVTLGDVDGSGTGTTTVGNTGGTSAHENRMPSMAMNWIIAIEGVYPSRS